MTLDASEGLQAGDEAAGVVLNKRTNAVAASLHGAYTPEELAEIGIDLGNWYNEALVAPENKGYGYMVAELIFKKYGNIYKRKKKIKTKSGDWEETEELGYNTNPTTRPQILAGLDGTLKNYSIGVKDKYIHSELVTFIQKKDKEGRPTKAEAESGCQDGLVMCLAIAEKVREEHPYVREKSTATDHLRRKRLDELRRTNKNAGFSFGGKK